MLYQCLVAIAVICGWDNFTTTVNRGDELLVTIFFCRISNKVVLKDKK